MKKLFLLVLLASGTAMAAAGETSTPEAVYQKLHAAAMARNVEEMLSYATEPRRAEMRREVQGKEAMVEMMISLMPRIYRITDKTASPDGNAVQLRTAGTGEFMGLGNTQMFGTIDFVKENGEWKVEHWRWGTDKTGAAPDAFAQLKEQPEPESKPEAKPEAKPDAKAEPKPEAKPESVLTIEKSTRPEPCVIKPVMSDDELRACGARIPK